MRLINLNLTRGTAEHITPEQIWAELGKLWYRRMTGQIKPTGPAKSGKPATDVRDLVQQLRTKPNEH
jgi:hypothetical protein